MKIATSDKTMVWLGNTAHTALQICFIYCSEALEDIPQKGYQMCWPVNICINYFYVSQPMNTAISRLFLTIETTFFKLGFYRQLPAYYLHFALFVLVLRDFNPIDFEWIRYYDFIKNNFCLNYDYSD